MPRRTALIVLAALALVLPGAAPARADGLAFAADATQLGRIDFYLRGPAGALAVVAERVGSETHPLRVAALDAHGDAILYYGARWRCDVRDRSFIAYARGATGVLQSPQFDVRTPSCRRRLTLRLPRQAAPGARVRLGVHDRWGDGDLPLRLCLVPPRARRRCRPLPLAVGATYATATFRPHRRGRWRIELTAPGLRVSRTLSVGERAAPQRRSALPLVLATGDSMMQGLDGFLEDRLVHRARVRSRVEVGTGISKPAAVGWVSRARRQAAHLRPRATVVFVGANDGFPMTTPAGTRVDCCGAAWTAEYSRRARLVMRAYLRGGRSRVLWLTLPAPRSELRSPAFLAIDAAVIGAAAKLPGVTVVRLDRLFTPLWRYTDTITYRGRRVRVREGDGLHLSIAGARIAADPVIAGLRAAAVVR